MARYIRLTAAGIFAAALIGGIAAVFGQNALPAQQSAENIPFSAPPAEYAFLLKEENGLLAVYRAGEERPEMILQILVHTLPPYDQAILAKGLPVADYPELVARIEDYSA